MITGSASIPDIGPVVKRSVAFTADHRSSMRAWHSRTETAKCVELCAWIMIKFVYPYLDSLY